MLKVSSGEKFTKREWIHLIITLSIVQGVIWFASFVYANNSNALGYVSFAGTLISIILAILAIGYTYGESHQQKNSSTTLANQIDELVQIKEDLKVQAQALDDIQILRLDLKQYAEKVDHHLINTNNTLGVFTEKLSDVSTHAPPKDGKVEDGLDGKLLFDKLFVSQDFKLNALALIFFVLNFENKEFHDSAPVSIKFLESIEGLEIEGYEKGALYGFSFHLALTLFRCGLANRDSNFIDRVIINKFNDLLGVSEDLESTFGDNNKAKPLLDYAKKSIYYLTDK